MRGGEGLTFILDNPSDITDDTPSPWNVALPANDYDALLLEPYITDTPANAATSFVTLVAAAKSASSARKFIYETWPQTANYSPGYQDYWNATPSGSAFTQQLASYTALYATLQADYGSNLWVIPAGSVFNAIDVAARAGQIAGVSTVADLHRDTIHMGDVGQFVANCTVFSTLFKRQAQPSARTLALYQTGSGSVILTGALMLQLAALVWSVVSADTRAVHA